MQEHDILCFIKETLFDHVNQTIKAFARINRVKQQTFLTCEQLNRGKRAFGWQAIASPHITIIDNDLFDG